MTLDPQKINSILATDCGSTTTKAILIEKVGQEYRLIVRGESPTTVEAPFEDVTKGVLNAVREVEELSGRKILEGELIMTPRNQKGEGVDIYVSTSSAGGGLQMMVGGVVKTMTGESGACGPGSRGHCHGRPGLKRRQTSAPADRANPTPPSGHDSSVGGY